MNIFQVPPTEKKCKGLSQVRLEAIKTLPKKTAQDTGSTGLDSQKRHEGKEARLSLCGVWHHLVETTLKPLECHIPSGKGQM
jgi:hypothetical protein